MPQKPRAKVSSKGKVIDKPATPPKWPVLQPLVPEDDLALETLLKNQIVILRNLFTPTLCKQYVSFLSALPLITTPVQPKAGNAVRVNDRIQFDDPLFAEQLWNNTALRRLVSGSDDVTKNLWEGEVCGLNPNIRIYRYSKLFLILLLQSAPWFDFE